MMTLRNFRQSDYPVLQKRYPTMMKKAIFELIEEWNLKDYKGQKFELLAIVENGQVVGSVSLFQHGVDIVHEGIEIYPQFRRHGYASRGIEMALARAKEQGYKIAAALVRQDNKASAALHRKLKFHMDLEFLDFKGTKMYYFVKAL